MTDAYAVCSRCGKETSSTNPLRLRCVGDSPGRTPEDILLCGHCRKSFQHWYERPGRSGSRGGADLEADDAREGSRSDARDSPRARRRRRHRHKPPSLASRVKVAAIYAAICCLAVGGIYFFVAVLDVMRRIAVP
jgi:hypothetical protein